MVDRLFGERYGNVEDKGGGNDKGTGTNAIWLSRKRIAEQALLEVGSGFLHEWVLHRSAFADATPDADRYQYGYDEAGNRLFRDNRVATAPFEMGRDWLYAYDTSHRLDIGSLGQLNSTQSALTSTTLSQDWGLDALGNWGTLTQTGTGAFSQTRSHNAANEVSTATGWTTTAHDAVGNMTTMPQPASPASGYTCVYDAWNRLVKVSSGSTTVAEYEYDGLNRRIIKSLGTGTVKEHFYYNESWQELEVRQENSGTESANPREQFVWHPYYIDALATRFYDSDVSNNTGVVQHYFTHDANFNVTAALDTSGNVVERYDYSPYGEISYLDNAFGSITDTTIAHRRAYTGQRLDAETGLYQYRNRYYHARLGRFISRDPIGYKGSPGNLYEYVGGRPLNQNDPYGLYSVTQIPCPAPVIAKCRRFCGRRASSPKCYRYTVYALWYWTSWSTYSCNCGECLSCVDQNGPLPPAEFIPGVPAHGCEHGHYHYFEYHQNPADCGCRRERRTGCLDCNGRPMRDPRRPNAPLYPDPGII